MQRRARCRRHFLTLLGLGTQKGRGVPRGNRTAAAGRCAPKTAGTTARLPLPEACPDSLLFFSLPSPVLSLPFTLSPVGRALRTDPGQDGLCVGPRRMSPTCHQLPSGSAPGRVLLSFLRRAPQTAGEVKGSWASAHSQGRSRGLDSFLPVRTSPGGLRLRSGPPLHLVVCSLCPSGKPGIR